MRHFLPSFVIVLAVSLGLCGTASALTTDEMLAIGSLGDAQAPVTVIEYASLTCPHCAAFENNVFQAFKAKYIDTGKVHYIYRDFPLDQMALRAAMMARCAGPDQYFGFLAVLFKQQENWATATDPLAALARIGSLGGVDKAQFDACMANKDLLDGILMVRQQAHEKFNIGATPTFIINGVNYEGDQPLADLDKILAPLLAKK